MAHYSLVVNNIKNMLGINDANDDKEDVDEAWLNEAFKTIKELNDMGYKTLYIRDTLAGSNDQTTIRVMNILKLIVNIVAVVVLLVLILKEIVKLVAFILSLPIKIVVAIYEALTGKIKERKNSQNKKRA